MLYNPSVYWNSDQGNVFEVIGCVFAVFSCVSRYVLSDPNFFGGIEYPGTANMDEYIRSEADWVRPAAWRSGAELHPTTIEFQVQLPAFNLSKCFLVTQA